MYDSIAITLKTGSKRAWFDISFPAFCVDAAHRVTGQSFDLELLEYFARR
jgi:hypothetical protein